MKHKTIYLGTSPFALSQIFNHDGFELEKAICERKRLSALYKEIADENKISVLTFDDKQELIKILEELTPIIEIFIIYQLDYIIPKNFANTGKYYNFHAGSLKTNRGAHPIVRSILNGDTKTELTLHRITEKIDQGLIVGKFDVCINDEEDVYALKEKMEEGFAQLLDKLIQFCLGSIDAEMINGGVYYKPIKEEDFTINIEIDSVKGISNKIRSQKQYKGALFIHNNQKYYIRAIENLKTTIANKCIITINEDSIEVNRTDTSFRLLLNKQVL